MTTKITKIVLFALLPLLAIGVTTVSSNAYAFQFGDESTITQTSTPRAQIDTIYAPVINGFNSGIVNTWDFNVPVGANSIESRNAQDICGQSSYVNGFYNSVYDKRGVSWQVPTSFNANYCGNLGGAGNMVLDKVEYTLSGAGDTTKSVTITNSADSHYKFYTDATANSGTMHVQIKVFYKHVI